MGVRADAALLESEARVESAGKEVARVEAAIGSPVRPLDAAALASKVERLGGAHLATVIADAGRPAAELVAAAGFG